MKAATKAPMIITYDILRSAKIWFRKLRFTIEEKFCSVGEHRRSPMLMDL